MKTKTSLILFMITTATILGGFSLYDKNAEKEPGNKLVVAFGDSLTYGYGDEKGAGYIDTLESRLNFQNKAEFNFTNEAIYGLESSGVLNQLSDFRISSKLDEADYFILFIGTNDLINSNGGNLKPIKPEAIKKGQEVYLQNLTGILKILKENNDTAPILLLGLYNPYPDSAQIEPIIDGWNNEILKTINGEKRITYIPTNDLFKGKAKENYFSDSLHLNDRGYRLIADRIIDKYPFK
ncbi:MAG TPA: hypothetical protein DCR24_10500 [Bacillus bacterium]|nr:hypothetical protein [Bacillus sp. (in: firmicutes)]